MTGRRDRHSDDLAAARRLLAQCAPGADALRRCAAELGRLGVSSRLSVRTRGRLAVAAPDRLPEAEQSVLLGGLGDAAADVRSQVAFALGEWGGAHAASTLARALPQEQDADALAYLISALRTIGGPDALAALTRLAEAGSSETARADAIAAIEELATGGWLDDSDREHLPQVWMSSPGAEEPAPAVRVSAGAPNPFDSTFAALERIAGGEAADDRTRRRAAEALRYLRDWDSTRDRTLVAALDDRAAAVRREAVAELAVRGRLSLHARVVLQRLAAADPDPVVAEAAAAALAQPAEGIVSGWPRAREHARELVSALRELATLRHPTRIPGALRLAVAAAQPPMGHTPGTVFLRSAAGTIGKIERIDDAVRLDLRAPGVPDGARVALVLGDAFERGAGVRWGETPGLIAPPEPIRNGRLESEIAAPGEPFPLSPDELGQVLVIEVPRSDPEATADADQRQPPHSL